MPKQWEADQLVEALRGCRWQRYFANGRAKNRHTDWPTIIRGWVGPNTFRAFPGMPRRPSEVFREWAYRCLVGEPRYIDDLLAVKSVTAYDKWLHRFADDFRRYWERQMKCEIVFGSSRKLPNLLMKGVCSSPEVPQASYERIVWFLHVPLDSYSIQAVRNCIGSPRITSQIGRIPPSASMGFVTTEGIYNGLQKAVRILAAKAEVPPIALDIVAWDQAHR
jgi:hypothetical protein